MNSLGSNPRSIVKQPHRFGHAAVHDLEDSGGRALPLEPQPFAELADRAHRRFVEHLNVAAELERGVYPSQDHVCVGRRGIAAAASVAGRAGIGPGARGSHLEQPGRIYPRLAPAARADGADVEHRVRYRDTELELRARSRCRDGTGNQAGVETGAANVGRHDGVDSHQAADFQARDDSSRRSALDHRHGPPLRAGSGHYAPIAAHYQQPASAAPLNLPLKARQVRIDPGLEIDVDDGGAGALVFTPLREYVGRDRYVRLGVDFLNKLLRAPLVARIQERKQVAHRYRAHALPLELCNCAAHAVLVERLGLLAVRPDPLGHFQAQRPLDQMPRLDPVEVERVGTHYALDAKKIAEALGGDKSDAAARTLDEHVGGNRASVNEIVDRARVDAGLANRVEDSSRRIVWRC